MLSQAPDVVADATNPKFAEQRQIFPDLGGVQTETLGKSLRRNRPDSGGLELLQAPHVQGEPPGDDLGNELGSLRGPAAHGGRRGRNREAAEAISRILPGKIPKAMTAAPERIIASSDSGAIGGGASSSSGSLM